MLTDVQSKEDRDAQELPTSRNQIRAHEQWLNFNGNE